MGTKCNRLLVLDTDNGSVVEQPLPEAPQRPWSAQHNSWGQCGIHSVRINPAQDMIATGGRDPTDTLVLRLPDFKPVQTLVVSGRVFCSGCV